MADVCPNLMLQPTVRLLLMRRPHSTDRTTYLCSLCRGDNIPRPLNGDTSIRTLPGGEELERVKARFRRAEKPVSRLEAERFLARVATTRAVKRVGTSKASLNRVSKRIWGHSFEEECVRRVVKRIRKDSTPRSIAAVRAAALRSMYAEVGRAMKEK